MVKKEYKILIDNRTFVPFDSSEEAWLWCCLCESLSSVRARGNASRIARPCESVDIWIAVKKLFQTGQLTPNHLAVLEKYGFQQLPPHEKFGQNKRECSLWREGLNRLESLLKLKGIVA